MVQRLTDSGALHLLQLPVVDAHRFAKAVLVENADGVQYCDAFGSEVKYSPLSEALAIPGHLEMPVLDLLTGAPGTATPTALLDSIEAFTRAALTSDL